MIEVLTEAAFLVSGLCRIFNEIIVMSTRRNFISASGKIAVGGMAALGLTNETTINAKNMFVHHVYFWLNNPSSKEDLNKLVEGLTALSKVKNLKMFHIGKPADTNREVIERGYAISWLCVFENKEEQDKYQVDPIHLKFIDNYKQLWSKVIVYDSVDF